MTFIDADPDELRATARHVREVARATATGPLRALAGATGPALADPPVAAALDRLATAWQRTLDAMVDDLNRLADGLDVAAQLYAELDRDAAADMRAALLLLTGADRGAG